MYNCLIFKRKTIFAVYSFCTFNIVNAVVSSFPAVFLFGTCFVSLLFVFLFLKLFFFEKEDENCVESCLSLSYDCFMCVLCCVHFLSVLKHCTDDFNGTMHFVNDFRSSHFLLFSFILLTIYVCLCLKFDAFQFNGFVQLENASLLRQPEK